MVTKLFFRNSVAGRDYSTANNDANLRGTAIGWNNLILSATAGTGSGSSDAVATVAGATPGVEITTSGDAAIWYSPPLDAAVTISGSITWNIWASENNASANVAINGRIERIDGATGVITLIDQTARTTEVALGTSAVNNFAETPAAGIACKRGDRLRVRIFGDDAGTMGTGFTFQIAFNGATGGATGDTWVQVTETLTFASEPAGSQVFPTEVASPVSTASTDLEAWTSRGGGVQTSVTNKVTGWTAPIQSTGTAGGTVIDWWTKPLTAFTLGGAVRVNLRGLSSNSPSLSSFRCEVAVTAGDGTGAVVWAMGGNGVSPILVEQAQSFLVSGTDVAVTNGQRLRIRLYIDDASAVAMNAGTLTIFYAGAAAATGDTFLTFTQALTEYVPYVPRNAAINHQDPALV